MGHTLYDPVENPSRDVLIRFGQQTAVKYNLK